MNKLVAIFSALTIASSTLAEGLYEVPTNYKMMDTDGMLRTINMSEVANVLRNSQWAISNEQHSFQASAPDVNGDVSIKQLRIQVGSNTYEVSPNELLQSTEDIDAIGSQQKATSTVGTLLCQKLGFKEMTSFIKRLGAGGNFATAEVLGGKLHFAIKYAGTPNYVRSSNEYGRLILENTGDTAYRLDELICRP